MCIKPWYKTDIKKTIPCGKCIGCRADKQKLWTERITSEAKGKRNSFITLTYREANQNYGKDGITPTLNKKQIKDWLDNLRHQIKAIKNFPKKSTKNFKYFLIGEYGGKLKRPHAHAIIIGLDFHDFKKTFEKIWKYGIVDVKPLEEGRIKYLTKYMMKSQSGGLAEEMYDNKGIERPFMLVSKKMGTKYIQEHTEEINKNGYIQEGLRKIQIPSYFKNLVFKYDLESITAREQKKMQDAKDREKAAKKAGFRDWNSLQAIKRRAHEKNTITKGLQKGEPYDITYYNGEDEYNEKILEKYEELAKNEI